MPRLAFLAAAAIAWLALSAPPAAAQRVVRAVMDADLRFLDPIYSPAYITRSVAYLIYDMLFALDGEGRYRPQMVERHETSADGLLWTFTLREGLVFSDGQPVKAEDCVASIRRWGARDGFGRLLMERTAALEVLDDRTFTIRLARPFGFVIEALGKPSSYVPVIMPARIAANTEPTAQAQEIVGSGPFLFRREQWVPGSRVVFDRNPAYRPRSEPASGFAGGKVVHIDRVEFHNIVDPSTAVAALERGEIDYIQYAPLDLLPRLSRNRQIRVDYSAGLTNFLGVFRMNHTQPPFDNPLVRRAVQVALNQEDSLAAVGVAEGQRRPCFSLLMCGGPFESDAGSAPFQQPSIERARELLRSSGYNNERTVLLHSTDVQAIDLPATVVLQTLRSIGMNVDDQAMDWPTLSERRLNRNPVGAGGWSGWTAIYSGYDAANPLTNYFIGYTCQAFSGWSCDEESKGLVQEFADTADPARQRAIAARLQERANETVAVVGLGQFPIPALYRSNLRGVLSTGIPLFWNMER